MEDSVAHLRSRWTPESTAAAIRFLRGEPMDDGAIGSMEQDGKTYFDLRGIRIEQTQLDGVTIRNVNLRWSTIRDVGFKNTKLIKCNLSQTAFGECYFRRALFQKCDIVNAKFSACDFSDARIEGSWLDFSTFTSCEIVLRNIRFRDDTTPQALVRVCRNLKLNAMSMGHFADAGELTYLERTYDRHALFNHAFSHAHEGVGERARSVKDWLGSVLLNWLWGYGEKPQRLALTMVANIVVFGTLQYWLNGVPGATWFDHTYFSGITFLTIGYGDLAPVGAIPRILAVLEGAAGIATFGMLIASAAKKIMYR
jgi:hypothetical protein